LIDVSPKSGGGVAAGRRARLAEAFFATDATGAEGAFRERGVLPVEHAKIARIC
jgi:hypothetical protein